MSNLLKSFSLVCNTDKRIIDSNEAMTIKLEEMRRMMTGDRTRSDGFTLGINPQNVEELLEGDAQRLSGESGEMAATEEELRERAESILADAEIRAKEIIETANADAGHIVDNAIKEAEDIKSKAYADGIEAGKAESRNMVNAERERINKEYEDKSTELEKEYQERLKKMEPELVDVMLDVFSSVTKVLSADRKDMILALVDKALSGTEANSNYIIKVCKEDAEFLRENRENILESINRDISIEIVEDVSMKRNECLIDTDLGIYDCSLDIQLENLIAAIKILSCTVEK